MNEQFIEQSSPFTDLFYYRIKNNLWIRNSKNILTVHETFKKGFYKTYLTNEILDQQPFVEGDVYYNIPLRIKIDSLVLTYPNYQMASKYYKEFWLRRKFEQNDLTVLLVLTEVQKISKGEKVEIRELHVNNKLKEMIQIVIDWQTGLNNNIALSHFDFLKRENMHQSAYNLLYENFFYANIELNSDSLKQTLTKKKITKYTTSNKNVFIMDNTK